MWNLKYKTNKQNKTELRLIDTENRFPEEVARGKGVGGRGGNGWRGSRGINF